MSQGVAGGLDHKLEKCERAVHQQVDRLRNRVRALETAGRRYRPGGVAVEGNGLQQGDDEGGPAAWWRVASGCPGLDRLLPERGLVRGTLVEWLSPGAGMGAGTLALIAAIQACRPGTDRESEAPGGVLVVLDRQRRFYPPAAIRWGADPSRMVILQPETARDERWALDQALRCPGVAAVWAELGELDELSFRRFQLAAEQGGVLGALVRPGWVRGRPSWSEMQLWVQTVPAADRQPLEAPAIDRAGGPLKTWRRQLPVEGAGSTAGDWRWQVRLLRCRGEGAGRSVDLEMDHRTGRLRAVAGSLPPVVSSHELEHEPDRESSDRESSGRSPHSLPLAAQLAHPAARRRSARA